MIMNVSKSGLMVQRRLLSKFALALTVILTISTFPEDLLAADNYQVEIIPSIKYVDDVNNRGDAVGRDFDHKAIIQFADGTQQTFDMPNGQAAYPRKINENGFVVGVYGSRFNYYPFAIDPVEGFIDLSPDLSDRYYFDRWSIDLTDNNEVIWKDNYEILVRGTDGTISSTSFSRPVSVLQSNHNGSVAAIGQFAFGVLSLTQPIDYMELLHPDYGCYVTMSLINRAGTVVGRSTCPDQYRPGAIWDPTGGFREITINEPDANYVTPYGITDAGLIFLTWRAPASDGRYENLAFYSEDSGLLPVEPDLDFVRPECYVLSTLDWARFWSPNSMVNNSNEALIHVPMICDRRVRIRIDQPMLIKPDGTSRPLPFASGESLSQLLNRWDQISPTSQAQIHMSSVAMNSRGEWTISFFERTPDQETTWTTAKYHSLIDVDSDEIPDEYDNCPAFANSAQADIDADGAGDLCDICPADATDACDPDGTTADEVSAANGGTLVTPDGQLELNIDPGDIGTDATISVTETVFTDPDVDLSLGGNPGAGQALAFYDLQPDGISFDSPVTLTIAADVSSLNASQRSNLDIYRLEDTDGDGVEETFVSLSAICTVLEEPVGVFTAVCTVELDHFSTYGLVAPLDSDGDGVPDLFGEEFDACPQEDATGLDIDLDGCIDSFDGLLALLEKLVVEGVIDSAMRNSLISKVENATQASTNENLCSALNQLQAFVNQVSAQQSKKISLESAALVITYAESVELALLGNLTVDDVCE